MPMPAMPTLGGTLRRTAPRFPTPEEEESLLGQTVAGVTWLGETLDKPGAAVRGMISGATGGEWGGGLLNLLPFSDTIGITDPSERIYGRDLLERVGIKDPNPGFQFSSPGDYARGLAGFGTEVITDPLTLLGGPLYKGATKMLPEAVKGAAKSMKGLDAMRKALKADDALKSPLTKSTLTAGAGDLTDVVSQTPATLSAAIKSGDAPIFSIVNPFWAQWMGASKDPIMSFGAQSGAVGEAAAKFIAGANMKVAYGKYSPVKMVRGMLSKSATRYLDKAGDAASEVTWSGAKQVMNDLNYSAMKQLTHGAKDMQVALDMGNAALKGKYKEIMSHLSDTGADAAYRDMSRQLAEGIMPDGKIVKEFFKTVSETPGGSNAKVTQLVSEMSDTYDIAKKLYLREAENLERLGYPIKQLDDAYATYGKRSSGGAAFAKIAAMLPGGAMGDKYKSFIRHLPFRHLPGGAARADQVAKDGVLWGFAKQAADEITDSSQLLGGYRQLTEAEHLAAIRPALLGAFREGTKEYGSQTWMKSEWGNSAWVKNADLDELQDAYSKMAHMGPAIEDSWRAKPDPRSHKLRPSDTDKMTFTRESELEAWIGEGMDMGKGKVNRTNELLNSIRAISPTTIRADIQKVMAKASKVDQARLQARLDAMGGGTWETGIFDQDALVDFGEYMMWSAEQKAHMYGTRNFLANEKMVGLGDEFADGALLAARWKDVGFTPQGMRSWVVENAEMLKAGADSDTAKIFDEIATETKRFEDGVKKSGQKSAVTTEQAMVMRFGPELDEIAGKIRMTPGSEGALNQFGQLAKPKVQNDLLDLWDVGTSLVKTGLYNIWIPSHMRDMVSDLWQAASQGKADFTDTLGGMGDVFRYLKDGTPLEYIDEIKALGVFKDYRALDTYSAAGSRRINQIPEGGQGLLGPIKQAWTGKERGSLNPTIWHRGDVALEAGKKQFAGIEMFNQLQNRKSFASQYGYYSALRKKGFSPAQAETLIKQAFFTSDEMSSFTRQVMGRIVPFWRFSSNNIPFQLSKLMKEPGGFTAQTLRAMTDATKAGQSRGLYTPSFKQETSTIPVGEDDPQSQSFFTNTVLPLNDFNQLVFNKGSKLAGLNVGRTLKKMASMLHPGVLAGPELAAGESMFSGRKLSDIKSVSKAATKAVANATGKVSRGFEIPEVDRLLHYSPLSRIVSMAWSMMDERTSGAQKLAKWAGAGSLSTYDTLKWKIIDTRDAYAKKFKLNPEVGEFSAYYLPKYLQDEMQPDEIASTKGEFNRRQELINALTLMKEQREGTTPTSSGGLQPWNQRLS